jgi:phage N-6-adenine-methyltransferase
MGCSETMTQSVHFSSATNEWATPQALFDRLDAKWRFDLDVCATPENAKCSRYFTALEDGLAQPWAPYTCWMNPPYGRAIKHWIKKAYEESLQGATVVCLIPSRTDTSYWHDYVMKGEVEFIRGRLKFGDATNSAPFPSAIVVFRSSILSNGV